MFSSNTMSQHELFRRSTSPQPHTIRCISLWQPWASLCCIKHPEDPTRSVKGFETRSWSTKHRGPLLIHAAQRFTRNERNWCLKDLIYESLWPVYQRNDPPTGAIIGRVTLMDVHPAAPMRELIDEYAEAMGDYRDGRYAWEITEPVLFAEPIPYRGQQGLFNVAASVVAEALASQQ